MSGELATLAKLRGYSAAPPAAASTIACAALLNGREVDASQASMGSSSGWKAA